MIRDPITLVPVNLPAVYRPLDEAYAHLSTPELMMDLFALRVSPLARYHHTRHEIESIQSEFHRRSVRN